MDEITIVKWTRLDDKQKEEFKALLKESSKNRFLAGASMEQLPVEKSFAIMLVESHKLIGFFTPTKSNWKGVRHWRSGVPYILPAYTQRGIMKKVLADYFATHTPAIAWIEDANSASIALYTSLGFKREKAKEGFGQPGHWYLLKDAKVNAESLVTDKPVYLTW